MLAVVILSFAIVLQLFAALRVFQLVRLVENRRPWMLLAIALASIALLDLMQLLQLERDEQIAAVTMSGILASLVKALLIAVSVFGLGPRLLSATRAERMFQLEGERYRLIFDHHPDLLILKDRSSSYLMVNSAFKRFIGKKDADLTGKTDFDFLPRSQANQFLKEDIKAIRTGALQVHEAEVNGVEGKRWLQFTRIPIFNAQGNFEALLVVGTDLTERKRLYASLQNTTLESKKVIDVLEYRLRLERLIASLGVHFISLPADQFDAEIRQALQMLGRLIDVDRSVIFLFSEDGTDVQALYEWNLHDSETQAYDLRDLTVGGSPWWKMKTRSFDVIHFTVNLEYKMGLTQVLDFLSKQGVKSFTAVPMISERAVVGYLAFVSRREEKNWSGEMLEAFKRAAEMFVSAIERKMEAAKVRETNKKVDEWVAKLEQRNRENTLVTEMENLLLVCRSLEEAYPIIARYARRLFPVGSGALYVIHEDRQGENVASWGQYPPDEKELGLNECWGLRRGRTHIVLDAAVGPHCHHVGDQPPANYLCVPLMAGGEIVGLLHLRCDPQGMGPQQLAEPQQRLATVVAEHIALTLSNLTLKDRLRSQAIRDPLTGLYNRRYMEETLERELRRAARYKTPVGVIMIDLDGFKPINDQFGHDTGDAMLAALSDLLLSNFRGEDVACRYGGDEFTIILPESTLSNTWQRAETLREKYKAINLTHEGKPIPMPTLSIGVAAFPEHGATPEELMQAADAATYAAKSKGRDRVMIAKRGGEVEDAHERLAKALRLDQPTTKE